MRMRRKNKKTNGMLGIIVIGIVAMNIVGIGYAYWNDSLRVEANVSTGFIDPYFDNAVEIGETSGRTNVEICDDDHTVKILSASGSAMGQDETGRFEFYVSNRGTVPVELKGINEFDPDGIADVEDNDGWIGLVINPSGQTAGIHEFEFEIIYEQR